MVKHVRGKVAQVSEELGGLLVADFFGCQELAGT
jgi:hypothetical protein